MKRTFLTLAGILTAGMAFASDADRFVLQERVETGIIGPSHPEHLCLKTN